MKLTFQMQNSFEISLKMKCVSTGPLPDPEVHGVRDGDGGLLHGERLSRNLSIQQLELEQSVTFERRLGLEPKVTFQRQLEFQPKVIFERRSRKESKY
jgi:hypothetical protein